MDGQALDGDVGKFCRPAGDVARLLEIDAELVLGRTGGDMPVGAGIHIRIDPERDSRLLLPVLGNLDRVSNSGRDSTLNCKIPTSKAAAISAGVLPTPAKTMASGGTPAARARRISPSETTSAPAPSLAKVAITAWLEFAFRA